MTPFTNAEILEPLTNGRVVYYQPVGQEIVVVVYCEVVNGAFSRNLLDAGDLYGRVVLNQLSDCLILVCRDDTGPTSVELPAYLLVPLEARQLEVVIPYHLVGGHHRSQEIARNRGQVEDPVCLGVLEPPPGTQDRK